MHKLWIKYYATFIQERRIWLFCGSTSAFFIKDLQTKNNLVQVFFLMTLFANEVSNLKVDLFSNLMLFMRQWGRKTIMNEILINVAHYRFWIENILVTNNNSKKEIPGKVNRPIKNSLASSHVVALVMKSIHYSYHVSIDHMKKS